MQAAWNLVQGLLLPTDERNEKRKNGLRKPSSNDNLPIKIVNFLAQFFGERPPALAKKVVPQNWLTEVLQILSISLTDKTHIRDLFDKTNFNDVKNLYDCMIPGLSD